MAVLTQVAPLLHLALGSGWQLSMAAKQRFPSSYFKEFNQNQAGKAMGMFIQTFYSNYRCKNCGLIYHAHMLCLDVKFVDLQLSRDSPGHIT